MEKRLPLLLLLSFFSCASLLNAQSKISDTEIYLLSYSIIEDQFKLESYSNISHNAGYDNQPYFSPDGNKIYYATMLDGKQTDIYEIDLINKVRKAVTKSQESEYSPTIISEDVLCYISINGDSSQQLYQLDLKTRRKSLKIKQLQTIGNYSWVNEKEVALYLTGASGGLVIFNTEESTYRKVTSSAGRCFSMIPNTNELSFIDISTDDEYMLKSFNLDNGNVKNIIPMLSGVEDYAWLTESKIIVGSDGKLAVFDLINKGYWKIIADLKKDIGEFYRIAVSPTGNYMAVVNFTGRKP